MFQIVEMNIKKILEISPWLEIFIKSLYWRSGFFYRILSKKSRSISKEVNSSSVVLRNIEFSQIIEGLESLGLTKPEIMIVHASALALNPTGLTSTEICQELLNYLGPSGTLAMPAIPLIRGEPTGLARFNDEICLEQLLYDVRKSPPWTGALPKALMKMSGSIRSRHPLNTMVAVGPQAGRMMEKNIEGHCSMGCGMGSSWKYCLDNNAQIVFLGVDPAHSMTMIHTAEDSWATQWPINNWYRNRKFLIRDGDFEREIVVAERRPRWSINYAERTLQKDLIAEGILKTSVINGLSIGVCQSKDLVDFLNARKVDAYPYFFPFWDKGF